jgi:hypothetical protein
VPARRAPCKPILEPAVGHGLWTAILGGVLFHAASRGNRLRLTGGVIGAYLLVSILHGIWDSMREIALVLTTVVTLASGQSMGIRSGAPDSATDTQILLFNLFQLRWHRGRLGPGHRGLVDHRSALGSPHPRHHAGQPRLDL